MQMLSVNHDTQQQILISRKETIKVQLTGAEINTASQLLSQSSRTVMDIATEQSVSKTDCNIQLSSVNQMALTVSTFRSQHQAAVDLLCTSV